MLDVPGLNTAKSQDNKVFHLSPWTYLIFSVILPFILWGDTDLSVFVL